MRKVEKRALEHIILKRRFDLWWWDMEENGKQNILQEDLMVYSKFESWSEDRQRMKQEMAEQRQKRQSR